MASKSRRGYTAASSSGNRSERKRSGKKFPSRRGPGRKPTNRSSSSFNHKEGSRDGFSSSSSRGRPRTEDRSRKGRTRKPSFEDRGFGRGYSGVASRPQRVCRRRRPNRAVTEPGEYDFKRDRGFNRRDSRPQLEMHKAICDDCKKVCDVPFEPTEGKPVFCKTCFERRQGIQGGADRNRRFERGAREMVPSRRNRPAESAHREFERPQRREFSRGRSDRRQGPEMFETVCDECGKTCEVPFKPREDKPVFCRECFNRRQGGGERGLRGRPQRRDFSRNQEARFAGKQGGLDVHYVMCASCGKECDVPFKPTQGKPVFCRDCFDKMRSGEAIPRYDTGSQLKPYDREKAFARRPMGRRSRDGGYEHEGPEMFKARCTKCKKICEVPFKPDPGKDVFCSDCFSKRKPDKRKRRNF